MSDLVVSLVLITLAWFFSVGMSKWSARRTSNEESWWLLAWGNFMRLGCAWSLIGAIYFLGKAIW